ncbi:MAG: hypothetical protein WCC17_02050 [Candidatus Nitrosopolaris sp.]|jgi:hypothetical protein
MRSFTFVPDQIVVNQRDTVTLHFLGVQCHVIPVEGVATFPLDTGHIHTVSWNNNVLVQFSSTTLLTSQLEDDHSSLGEKLPSDRNNSHAR